MPFQHVIDEKLDIVIVKATGIITVADIITEIKLSVATKRGGNVSRRLMDLSEQDFLFDIESAKAILNNLKQAAKVLRPKRIAILLKEIPDKFDLQATLPLLNSPELKIGLFVDRARAIEFLNQIQ